PALLVPRAFFAARGGDAHHPVTVANGLGHQAGHKVRLVVRMRPDAEQGPERRDRDRHGSRPACMAAGSLPQPSRVTTWWTAHASTVRGKSTRKWPPRLSSRRRAAAARSHATSAGAFVPSAGPLPDSTERAASSPSAERRTPRYRPAAP